MKKTIIISVAAIAALFTVASCGNNYYKKGDRMPETTDSKVDSVSYALGMYLASTMTMAPFGEINMDELQKGFEAVLVGNEETEIKQNDVNMIIQMHLMQRQAYVANAAKEQGEEFLLKNKEKEGVVETESGLQYKILEEGSGISPEATDTVEVHYEGKLLDGTVFDSSYKNGETVKFPLTSVIKGWSEGITYAKEGGKIELYIPSELAYGRRGAGPIPGNSTLIFNIELIKVSKAAPKAEEKSKVEAVPATKKAKTPVSVVKK